MYAHTRPNLKHVASYQMVHEHTRNWEFVNVIEFAGNGVMSRLVEGTDVVAHFKDLYPSALVQLSKEDYERTAVLLLRKERALELIKRRNQKRFVVRQRAFMACLSAFAETQYSSPVKQVICEFLNGAEYDYENCEIRSPVIIPMVNL